MVMDECGISNLGLLDPAGVIVEHSYIRRVPNYRSPSEVEESEVEESMPYNFSSGKPTTL
jgi:hypothetical protein